jgi:hypothetical protein
MGILSANPILTPLGLAACVLLLAFSLLWRGQKAKRSEHQGLDEKRKGMYVASQTSIILAYRSCSRTTISNTRT